MIKPGRVIAKILPLVLVPALVVPSWADTRDELSQAEQEKNAAESLLQETQDRIDTLESKKGEAESYLKELNDQLTELNAELDDLQQQYSDKQIELDTVSQELSDAQSDEELQRENMKLRIQYMYENSMDNGAMSAAFSADDFSDFLTAATQMSELAAYDREMLEEYAATCRTVEEKQQQVIVEQEEIAVLEQQSEEKKEEIVELCEQTSDQVEQYASDLEGEQAEAGALLESIRQQESRIAFLNEKIEEEIRAAEEAARKAAAEAAARKAAEEAARKAEEQAAQQDDDDDGDWTADPGEPGGSEDPEGDGTAPASEEELPEYTGAVLSPHRGFVIGPSGEETYYNLNMSGVVKIMRAMGNTDKYWVRSDGCKMLGDYIMCAANLSVHPRGSYVASSLGMCIVCDTGGFATAHPNRLDIATNW